MVRFAALDVHKRVVEAVILDAAGEVLWRGRFPCTRESLEAFARARLTHEDRLALEATTNTWGVVAVLKPFVAEVVASNPLRTRAIAYAKVKTDKVDATVLAQLLRCDYLPRVWEPDEKTQELRRLTGRRAGLCGDRTRLKNRIHSVLHQRLIAIAVPELFNRPGLAWLRALTLDPEGRATIDSDLRMLEGVDREIAALDAILVRLAYPDARVRLLMTLPGVDVGVAMTLLAALGDVTRFRDADHAAGYLGLVPSTTQSAEHCYHGRITKAGNGHARWMLVQAAQHVSAHPGPLGVFFRRLAKKKNRNVAVVAVARKLVVIAWHMLTKNEPYRYAQPMTTQTKLARLRIKATGRRLRGGVRKGGPRPDGWGTGQGTHVVLSVDEIMKREQLPPCKDLTPGETRTVQKAGATEFVKAIHQTRRALRCRKMS